MAAAVIAIRNARKGRGGGGYAPNKEVRLGQSVPVWRGARGLLTRELQRRAPLHSSRFFICVLFRAGAACVGRVICGLTLLLRAAAAARAGVMPVGRAAAQGGGKAARVLGAARAGPEDQQDHQEIRQRGEWQAEQERAWRHAAGPRRRRSANGGGDELCAECGRRRG